MLVVSCMLELSAGMLSDSCGDDTDHRYLCNGGDRLVAALPVIGWLSMLAVVMVGVGAICGASIRGRPLPSSLSVLLGLGVYALGLVAYVFVPWLAWQNAVASYHGH
jgi:hypothetical protein